jgi:nucleoside-diphosphate-sugar epimerase
MSIVLITGAHGFVGANLSKYLAAYKQYQLFAIDILKKTTSFYNREYTWKEFNKINFNSIHTVVHLAGKAHDTNNNSKANEYFEINVGLTMLVYNQFIKSDANKFIYFSSVKAVADSVKNGVLTEEDLPHPQTPYGQSKLEAEKYLTSQALPEGKSLFILRPAMIHGPGNKGNLNLLFNLINYGIPYPLGAFSNQRSFTSIGNLNFVIKEFIDREMNSGIYQVADTETLSTIDIIELIGEAICRKPKIWNIPAPFINGIAKAGNILSFPLNSEKLKKLTENYLVSNRKLVDALGVELPIHAREGLKFTLSSLKTNQIKFRFR